VGHRNDSSDSDGSDSSDDTTTRFCAAHQIQPEIVRARCVTSGCAEERSVESRCNVNIPARATTEAAAGRFTMKNVYVKMDFKPEFTMIKAYIRPIDDFISFLVSTMNVDVRGLFVQTHCIVCMVEPPTWVCVPCNHLIFCEADKNAYCKSANSTEKCPMCRTIGRLQPANGSVVETTEIVHI
jgi:hypothetical protein